MDFPSGPVVKNLPSNAGDMGLIPGWQISHAVGQLRLWDTTTEPAHRSEEPVCHKTQHRHTHTQTQTHTQSVLLISPSLLQWRACVPQDPTQTHTHRHTHTHTHTHTECSSDPTFPTSYPSFLVPFSFSYLPLLIELIPVWLFPPNLHQIPFIKATNHPNIANYGVSFPSAFLTHFLLWLPGCFLNAWGSQIYSWSSPLYSPYSYLWWYHSTYNLKCHILDNSHICIFSSDLSLTSAWNSDANSTLALGCRQLELNHPQKELFFFLIFNWRVITILCWFLPYINMDQSQVYMCPLPPEHPSTSYPIPPLQVITEPWCEFPESHSTFPLGVYFTKVLCMFPCYSLH